MKALVVYESMFGNTRRLAEAVAEGLRTGADVDLRPVAAAPPEPDPEYQLVVVGGPTHAFSMSRPSTRADAVRQGPEGEPTVGIREWLDGLPTYGRGTLFAAFDSRVWVRNQDAIVLSPSCPAACRFSARRTVRAILASRRLRSSISAAVRSSSSPSDRPARSRLAAVEHMYED